MSGAELIQKIVKETKRRGVEIHVGERVMDLEITEEEKIVKTLEREYSCEALIVATGPRCKFLNVPGESWLGRGVSYCAVCDGKFFRDGQTIVVGSENEAVQEALVLTQVTRKITLVTNAERLKAESSLVEDLKRKDVHIIEGCMVEAIERGELLNNLIIIDAKTGEKRVLHADGIFIALGKEPTTLNVEKIGVKTHMQGGILC